MNDPRKRIEEIETLMADATFWDNKERAQTVLRELNDLKTALAETEKYERGNAVITIYSGAGGDDAEDFSRILLEMYLKYADRKG